MNKTQPARSSRMMRAVRKFFVSGFVIATFVAYVLHERFVNPTGDLALSMPEQKTTLLEQPVDVNGQPVNPDDDNASAQADSPLEIALANESASPTAQATATPTQQPTGTATATATAQPSATATSTALVEKAVPASKGQQALENLVPSATPTEQTSPTDQPTPTDQSTPTEQPTQTAAPTFTVEPTRTPRPTATRRPSPTPTAIPLGLYKDGNYTGQEADAFYGLVQVDVSIQNGKMVDVQFLEYPNHRRTSVRINQRAAPVLQREALQAQNAKVDLISGATLTSRAFRQSLQSALDQAASGI